MTSYKDVLRRVKEALEPESNGWELKPFQVSWYNKKVAPIFRLPHDSDTLGILILSTPAMFERVFLPWLRAKFAGKSEEEVAKEAMDPIDQCISEVMSTIPQKLGEELNTEIIHDFELLPSRRPKILMGTCGHAAGAAYYYQVGVDIPRDEWEHKQSMGVAVHPLYGGWFAFRTVLLFPGLRLDEMPELRAPKDVLAPPECPCEDPLLVDAQRKAKIRETLELFNLHWADGRYRDVVPVLARYSEAQSRYFSLLPGQRGHLIMDLVRGL